MNCWESCFDSFWDLAIAHAWSLVEKIEKWLDPVVYVASTWIKTDAPSMRMHSICWRLSIEPRFVHRLNSRFASVLWRPPECEPGSLVASHNESGILVLWLWCCTMEIYGILWVRLLQTPRAGIETGGIVKWLEGRHMAREALFLNYCSTKVSYGFLILSIESSTDRQLDLPKNSVQALSCCRLAVGWGSSTAFWPPWQTSLGIWPRGHIQVIYVQYCPVNSGRWLHDTKLLKWQRSNRSFGCRAQGRTCCCAYAYNACKEFGIV